MSAFRGKTAASARPRLNCISHVLKAIPYKRLSPEAIKLPKRSMKGHYNDAATLRRVRFAQGDIELHVTNHGRSARVQRLIR